MTPHTPFSSPSSAAGARGSGGVALRPARELGRARRETLRALADESVEAATQQPAGPRVLRLERRGPADLGPARDRREVDVAAVVADREARGVRVRQPAVRDELDDRVAAGHAPAAQHADRADALGLALAVPLEL